MNFLTSVAVESLKMFNQAAPYMTMGILLGGLLKAFISEELVQKYLGGRGISPVFRASLAGVPLPLCSCGVIPAAAALKKQGASSSATVSFLISTPESGIDSIALSYALLDPILTVARPIIAFISAFAAGIASVLWGGPEHKTEIDKSEIHDHGHGHDHSPEIAYTSLSQRIKAGLDFAINDIWADLAGTFFIGIILSGIIATIIPSSFLGTYLGGGLRSMLIMLVAGIPMYICASSSTPLAAALILKGVSPGAALVFLMAGPATNVSALPVLNKILGARRLAIYLTIIAVISVTAGLSIDWIYSTMGISAQASVGEATEMLPQWLHVASATLLIILWLSNLIKKYIKAKKLDQKSEQGG